MKITDKAFIVDMADVFEAGLSSALEADSEVFAFSYAGLEPTATLKQRQQVAGCHPEMKCVVLLWPAALADLLMEGIPYVRSQMTDIAAQVASRASSLVATCGHCQKPDIPAADLHLHGPGVCTPVEPIAEKDGTIPA